MDLAACSAFLRVLSDSTRLRLLALLEQEELTVAELAGVTRLAQPRVSTHLAKLKDLDLVRDRRAGVSAYYRYNGEAARDVQGLWQALRQQADDALLRDDARRLAQVLAKRSPRGNWADSVAGDMERHYSPGRTWEPLARALAALLELGDVLDIASGDGVVAELLAPRARSITCVDAGERVVEAARRRLAPRRNVRVEAGDMHALAFPEASFDVVLMLHALTYSEHPATALAQAARVLRPGGRLVALTLARHAHRSTAEAYDHRNLGFAPAELRQLATRAGLAVNACELVTRERRPPHFEVLLLKAVRS